MKLQYLVKLTKNLLSTQKEKGEKDRRIEPTVGIL